MVRTGTCRVYSETGVLAIYPRTFAKCSPHTAEFAIFIRNLQAGLAYTRAMLAKRV